MHVAFRNHVPDPQHSLARFDDAAAPRMHAGGDRTCWRRPGTRRDGKMPSRSPEGPERGCILHPIDTILLRRGSIRHRRYRCCRGGPSGRLGEGLVLRTHRRPLSLFRSLRSHARPMLLTPTSDAAARLVALWASAYSITAGGAKGQLDRARRVERTTAALS
jgi:hypothetical protein